MLYLKQMTLINRMLLSLKFQQLLAISLGIIFCFHISTFSIYSCSTEIAISIISPTLVSFSKLVSLQGMIKICLRDMQSTEIFQHRTYLCSAIYLKRRQELLVFLDTSTSTVISLVSPVMRLWTSQK